MGLSPGRVKGGAGLCRGDTFCDRAKSSSLHQARHPLPLAKAQVVPCVRETDRQIQAPAWSPCTCLPDKDQSRAGAGWGQARRPTAGVDVTGKGRDSAAVSWDRERRERERLCVRACVPRCANPCARAHLCARPALEQWLGRSESREPWAELGESLVTWHRGGRRAGAGSGPLSPRPGACLLPSPLPGRPEGQAPGL